MQYLDLHLVESLGSLRALLAARPEHAGWPAVRGEILGAMLNAGFERARLFERCTDTPGRDQPVLILVAEAANDPAARAEWLGEPVSADAATLGHAIDGDWSVALGGPETFARNSEPRWWKRFNMSSRRWADIALRVTGTDIGVLAVDWPADSALSNNDISLLGAIGVLVASHMRLRAIRAAPGDGKRYALPDLPDAASPAELILSTGRQVGEAIRARLVAVFEYVWTDGVLVKRYEIDTELDPDTDSALKTGPETYPVLTNASVSVKRLTGCAWTDDRYRHIAVFDHLSQRDRDLVDPGSADRHAAYLNEPVRTCLYGRVGDPEPRYFLRFINRSGATERFVPFVSEKVNLDEFLANLRSDMDFIIASMRTRALENATRLAALNAGDPEEFIAALARDLLAEHVDSLAVLSHQAGTRYFGRILLHGDDVQHVQLHGRDWTMDKTYTSLLADVCVRTKPAKGGRLDVLSQITRNADAVLSLPFQVGNTTGTMLIPFPLGGDAGRSAGAIVGGARLGFLRACARLVGDALDSGMSRRLAEGARHALGALGHELASPLAILGSSAEVSLNDIRRSATLSEDRDASAEDLREIRALATAGLERVNDSRESAAAAMAVAQIVAEENDGRLEMQFARFALGDLVLRAIEQVEQERVWRIGKRIYEFEPKESVLQLGPTVADSRLILAALKNLLRNAAKFSMTRGSSVCTIEVFAERQSHMDIVIVRNWGRSILPEDREIIFEPWIRIDTDSEIARRGMGLGLFLARRIAVAHGGDVLCRKSGTSFTLTHEGVETEFEIRIPTTLKEGAYFHRWRPGERSSGPERQPQPLLGRGGLVTR